MTPEERRQEILKLLDKKKFITVDDLASLLFTSKPTIRRDLLILEEGGFIRRTKGGAQAIVSSLVEWPFTMRNAKNNEQKAYIAEIAKDFLNDHANIFIDSSSTCLHFAKEVAEFDNITVLTNGIKTAHFLSEESNNNVSVTCGKIYKKETVSTDRTPATMYRNTVLTLPLCLAAGSVQPTRQSSRWKKP